jgi:hypothetical protein
MQPVVVSKADKEVKAVVKAEAETEEEVEKTEVVAVVERIEAVAVDLENN